MSQFTQSQDAPAKKRMRLSQSKSVGLRSYTNAAIRKAVQAARETKKVYERNQELSLTTVGGGGFYRYDYPIPQQGPDSHERIGTKINPTHLEVKYLINNNDTKWLYVRLLVVRIKQGNLGPTMASFFDGTAGADVGLTGTTHDIICPINHEELQVMNDQVITVAPGQNYNGGGFAPVKFGTIKSKPLKNMVFSDSGGSNSVNHRYSLFVIGRRSDNDESLGETFEFSYDMTMLYKD